MIKNRTHSFSQSLVYYESKQRCVWLGKKGMTAVLATVEKTYIVAVKSSRRLQRIRIRMLMSFQGRVECEMLIHNKKYRIATV